MMTTKPRFPFTASSARRIALCRASRLLPIALVAAVCASTAQAQVNLSGRLDASAHYVDDGIAKLMRVDNGIASASRLVFEGSEDLGGGLSALFHLQHRFAVDTGAATNAAKFWNFGAFVGLSSKSLGTLTIGRQYVPMFYTIASADDSGPLKLSLHGVAQALQRGTTARVSTAASPIKTAGSLDAIGGGIYTLAISTSVEDNLAIYKTPTIGGATVSVAIGAPEGYPQGSGKILAGNVEYRAGSFYGSLAVNSKEGRVPVGASASQKVRDYVAAAFYSITQDLKVWGNVHPWRFESAGTELKGRDFSVGASYYLPQGHQFWANVGNKRIDNCSNCGTRALGVGYHHVLSKRTQLYVSHARINNDANAGNGLVGVNPGTLGKNVLGTAAGIVVLF